jgi:hypothetical protein
MNRMAAVGSNDFVRLTRRIEHRPLHTKSSRNSESPVSPSPRPGARNTPRTGSVASGVRPGPRRCERRLRSSDSSHNHMGAPIRPNGERSHAGPIACEWNRSDQPALAGAICWMSLSLAEHASDLCGSGAHPWQNLRPPCDCGHRHRSIAGETLRWRVSNDNPATPFEGSGVMRVR